ncbi:hypothetical protein B484DRAFT_410743, partial [Ochromonadaceae sp. CCMP2298]
MLMENHKLYSLATRKRMYVDGIDDKERCHWRCTDRNCQGSGSTVRAEDDNSHHTPFISIHDHAAICKWNQSTIVINYYQNEVYRRFRDDAAMLVDLHGHYSWAVTQLQVHYPALVQHFPAQIHFVSTASRIHTSRVPPVPSRNQPPTLVVPPRWAFSQTYPGGRFLQHKDSHQGMHTMVFGTDECFTAVCGTTKVFMDGTFFVCPWTRARLDFENGMALYRKLGDHHLQSHYKVLHLGVYGVLLQRPNMDPWFDYVYNCYVKDGATVARREDWTVCDLDSFRTNNNLEGYHCKIKTRLSQQHPNMWRLITFLQDDARETAAT